MEIIRIGSRKCKGCKKRTQCYKLANSSRNYQLCRKCFPHEIPENRGKATGNPTGRNTAPARKAAIEANKTRSEMKLKKQMEGLEEYLEYKRKQSMKSKKSKADRIRKKLAELTKDMIPADSIPIGHRIGRLQCRKCRANGINPSNITHISNIIPKRGPREVICGSCGVIE